MVTKGDGPYREANGGKRHICHRFGAWVEYGGMQEDHIVLITAAGSSVGLAAIQIAKSLGALAIATTRGPDRRQFLLDHGAHRVVVKDSGHRLDDLQNCRRAMPRLAKTRK
jgi:NADPH:quinone reductase-like Zn-dependent oxidoreductase